MGRRLAATAVALAVFATAAVFAWDLSHPERRPDPRPTPAVDLASELPEGWSELPAPPEVRSRAATAWTGSQLLVWGGYVFDGGGDKTPADDGFVFDARSRTWARLPDGPLSPRSNAAAAWTGKELLIWGGFRGVDCCTSSEMFLDDGAAFDPATGRWRTLAQAPLSERAPFSVWTGEELIVWGSTGRELYLRDGAAYDPSRDSWRAVAKAPFELSDATTVWTGREMIVFGSSLDGNNRPETPTAIGIAYDPDTDTWRELTASPLSPQAHTAGWPADGEMIAWDYEHGSAAYEPMTDSWRRLNDVPLRFYECYPRSATVPGNVFGNYCGQLALYSATDDAWTEITRKDLRNWLIEPAPAGSAFLVLAHSLELSEQPDVTFDTRMLAYVPRAIDAAGDERNPSSFVPATETVGDEVRMPVVFPDGTGATIVYPIGLDLAELGLQPDISYVFEERYQGPIVFIHDPDASLAGYVEGTTPIGRASPDVEIWASREDPEYRNASYPDAYLRYQLPTWTGLVPLEDRTIADEVVTSLELRETSSGFPVIDASGQAQLAEGFGEAGGPQIAFGDGNAHPFSVLQLDEFVELSPDGCDPQREVELSDGYGATCLGDGSVFASVYGDRRFVTSVIEGLRIEDFQTPSTLEPEPTPFVPEAVVDGSVARAALTFPNGATATLVYPEALRLARFGVQPDNTYTSGGDASIGGGTGLLPIVFIHGPIGAEHDYVAGSRPLRWIRGAGGKRLGLWEAIPLGASDIEAEHWLLHRVGGWTVLIGLADPATAGDAAASLIVHFDSTGMPWIEPRNGFELSPFAGDLGGTNLTIGDIEPAPGLTTFEDPDFPFIEIHFFECREGTRDVSADGEHATVCTGGGHVAITMSGRRQQVRPLLEGVRIEDFRPR